MTTCLSMMSRTGVAERFALENNIPRVVPFGDNANELVAIHHDQRSNVFFSHFRDGIEDGRIRVNRPNFPALLIKQLSHVVILVLRRT